MAKVASKYLVVAIGSSKSMGNLSKVACDCITQLTGRNPHCEIVITAWSGEPATSGETELCVKLRELSSKLSEIGEYQEIKSAFVVLSTSLSKNFVANVSDIFDNDVAGSPQSLADSAEMADDEPLVNKVIDTNPQIGKSTVYSGWQQLKFVLDAVSSKGRAVVVIQSPVPQLPKKASRDLSIEEFQTEQEFREYILARIGRDIFRFSFHVGDKFNDNIRKYLQDSSEVNASCDLISKEYHDWFAQEFGDFGIGDHFLNCCWEPLLGIKAETHGEKLRTLPWKMQVAIGVSRMCRRLSTWTLEGTPFECTVVLVSQSAEKIVLDNQSKLRSIIDLEPCPFNFSNEDRIRQFAEMSQGLPLLMVVSAADGCLHHVAAFASQEHIDLLHLRFSALAGDNAIVFRVRPQGRVGVFTRDSLQLSFDGFQWQKNPFSGMERAVESHFSSRPDILQKCLCRLREATQQLLDASNSSIFILVHPNDARRANELSGESLRSEVALPPSVVRLKIDDLDSHSLSSFLHLDGAHFIDANGCVYAIARRIPSIGGARHEIEIPENHAKLLRDSMHLLPAGAEVCANSEGTKHFLRFPRRIQGKWLKKWATDPKPFPEKVLEAIEKNIFSASSGLFQVSKILFKDSTNENQLTEIQEALKEERFDSEVCQYDSDEKHRWGLIVWKEGMISSPAEVNLGCVSLDQPSKDAVVKKCVELGRTDCEFEQTDPWFFISSHRFDIEARALTRQIPGLAVRKTGAFLVLEEKFDSVLNSDELPYPMFQIMHHWDRYGRTAQRDAPGTGTRAAQELSKAIPESWVIKVSSSGKIKIWRGGNDESVLSDIQLPPGARREQ